MDPARLMSSAALTVAVATLFAPPVLGWMQNPAPQRPAARLDVSVTETAAPVSASLRHPSAYCATEPTDSASRVRGAAVFAENTRRAGTMSSVSR
ncbi:hypothetical protein [Alsobacter sp. R-9]